MICLKYNRVHVCRKDGSRCIILRCADPLCIHFTEEVTDRQCSQCPSHLAAVETTVVETAAPKTPSLIPRALTYARAVAGWIAAGRPERSEEETQRLFCQFCKTCGWYDGSRQICQGCGCKVSEFGQAILNKIKMATQSCPRNLW